MNLTKISIDRPVFAWMLMAFLVVFGAVSFNFLGVSSLPDVDFPTVNISITYKGASPEVIESDVVDVLESAVMGVSGLKGISSSSRFGSANINLEFDIDRPVDLALQEVQSKIAQAQRRLPAGTEPPVVSKQNPEDQPIMWLAISGPLATRDLMAFARDKIIPQFQLLPGVGDVFLGGYLEPNIRVTLDAKKLEQYELSIDDIVGAINREHVEKPAGLLQYEKSEYTLRVTGEAHTIEELSDIVISRRGGSPIYSRLQLKDVATIEKGTEDIRRVSRVNGQPAVGIGIRKQRGTNAVAVADAVRNRMEEVRTTLPKNVEIGVNFDSTKFIKESIHELEFELILSAILTAIVCWLFFGSIHSTINILLAIPTSLIGSFIAIKFFGFTLNNFTFLGLILAIGIVVDDAIMVLENIFRHKAMGKSNRQAALEGTQQIAFAAMATTFAIVAIFLPIAFMDGVIGKFIFQFAITLSCAVLLSLLEALTLTPMRASQFTDQSHKPGLLDPLVARWTIAYKKSLAWALEHRWTVLLGSLAFFFSSLLLVGVLRKEFVPSQDQSLFMLRISTNIGSSIEFTDEKIREVEKRIDEIPEINRFFVAIGGFGGGQVNTAVMFITLKDASERKASQADIMNQVREKLKSIENLRVVVQDLSTGGFGSQRGFPIEFSIRGPEWEELVALSKSIQEKMTKELGFIDVDSNYDEGMPEVRIVPDRERAAQLGVSVDDMSRAVGLLIGGEDVARFTEGSQRLDIHIRLKSEFRANPQSILNIRIRNNRGEFIPLREVAKIDVRKSLVAITRESRERAITITSNVLPKFSQAKLVEHIEGLRKDLPTGYSLVFGGSSKSFGEGFSGLKFALWFGVVIAFMILASQFNSCKDGFIVLLSMPFSLSGAFLALWLGGVSLNIYSMIGLVLLMGIVKKNSIMLVDFTNQKVREGLDIKSSLLEACPIRLRPILMTSLTIIAASIPPVLALGPGSETRSSMSLAVMGGVFVSTLMTLFVIPVVYSLMSKNRKTAKS